MDIQEINYEAFPEALEWHLKTKGIAQKEFAQSAKVSEQNVSLWLNRDAYPNLDSLIKVADFLNYSLDFLLGRTEHEEVYLAIQRTSFQKRLKFLMEKNHQTANYIATACKFKNYNFTRWQRGATPTPELLNKLAYHFNVSVDYLVGRSDSI